MVELRNEAPSLASTSAKAWKDWHWLLALAALIVPVRIWLLCHTEVMARDSIGFIRYALLFDDQSWNDVVRSIHQHPGYPWAVWLVSIPVRGVTGQLTPEIMQLCAQLVSGLAASLLILPGFYLGKALGDARVGFGGCLIFQLLPTSGQHLSDGVSESLFLLFLATALLGAVRGAQDRRWRWFAISGCATGLAYLTRPEGALVLAAVGSTLALAQTRSTWRQSWRQCLGQGLCFLTPALMLGACYVVPTGRLTNKPSIQQLMKVAAPTTTIAAPRTPGLRAELWADAFILVRSPFQRFLRGCRALCVELAGALHYLGVVPLLGLLIGPIRRLASDRGWWMLAVFAAYHTAALLWLAGSAGYLSDRHLLPLVLILSYLVMIGLLAFAERWQNWRSRPGVAPCRRRIHGAAWSALAVLLITALPQTLKKLHGNRAGNHEAGLWLAQRLQPGDVVLDDHCWSHFYAHQVFVENKEISIPPDRRPTCYVVITRSSDPKVKVLRDDWERRLQYSQGEIVYHWPPLRGKDEARVVVYALPRDARTQPWRIADHR